MSRRPVISDVIDYLQQQKDAAGDIVVVPTADDIQAPGDYVIMKSFFEQFELQQEHEDDGDAGRPSAQRPS